jgi:hypothetical protein
MIGIGEIIMDSLFYLKDFFQLALRCDLPDFTLLCSQMLP